MSKRETKLYVSDVIEAIDKIFQYTKELSYGEFCANNMVIDAVVRNITIIGEATDNVPAEIKKTHSDIPWRKIKDMRNTIIHEYFGVDKKVLWKTIQNDLSPLKRQIAELIDEI